MNPSLVSTLEQALRDSGLGYFIDDLSPEQAAIPLYL